MDDLFASELRRAAFMACARANGTWSSVASKLRAARSKSLKSKVSTASALAVEGVEALFLEVGNLGIPKPPDLLDGQVGELVGVLTVALR